MKDLQPAAIPCDPLATMKHCPQCNSTFSDPSLRFCLSDGTPLTSNLPRFDAEAETLKNIPKKPEMSPQDVIMEIANYLRSTVSPGERTLIRFEQVTALGLTIAQVSEHFKAAAEKADCEVIDKTDTRATVRRESARLVRA